MSDPHPKWYKFDDGDVSECKMDDDEVIMKTDKSLLIVFLTSYNCENSQSKFWLF